MSTIHWGLIGCGDVVRKRIARSIQDEPRSMLLAAARRQEARIHEFCDLLHIERAYSDPDDLLSDPQIDAVYIATPVREHLPQTLAAAKAGKHVLVEKPMAMSVAECDQMITACRDAGVKLGVAYYRRFYPIVHRMQELIQSGAIGTPLAVAAITSTRLPMPESGNDPLGGEACWRAIPQQGGGGALMDVGSHRINLFLHLFGPVRQVKAFCETVAADYQAEETAVLLMKFQSGIVGTLQCHFRSSFDPDEFTITGTAGRLTARPLNGEELVIETGQERRSERHPPASNLSDPLIADFVSAILKDRVPTVTGEEGRLTNDIIERAYSDARAATGKKPHSRRQGSLDRGLI